MAKIFDVEVGENIHAITETAGKYPQDSYAAVVCAIQLEWIFLQHVIKGTGRAVEKLIREKKILLFSSENLNLSCLS